MINYANEKLQQFFNHHVFEEEIKACERENINCSDFTYMNNQVRLFTAMYRHYNTKHLRLFVCVVIVVVVVIIIADSRFAGIKEIERPWNFQNFR